MSVILFPNNDVDILLKNTEHLFNETERLLKETNLLFGCKNKMVEEDTSCNDWDITSYICKKIFSPKNILHEVIWDKIMMVSYKDGSMKIVFIEINMNCKTKIDIFDKDNGYFIKIKRTREYLKQLVMKHHHPKIKIQHSILGILKYDPIFMYLTETFTKQLIQPLYHVGNI